MRKRSFKLKRSAIIAASIHVMFNAPGAWANPTGAQVVNGQVGISRPNASTLNVTNSPGSIVNWQGFSIGANEVTRFIQQSSSSAILNRVVGPNISSLQGQLLSNGRVFLINPAGIVVGPGAMIDTAGFVGSTLNMLDADFLAGKLRFQGDASSGSIINQGWIRTGYGGKVVLVAPNIENSGLIQTPGGELILAAGKSLTIGSLEHEGVQFEVQAPTDSVVNVGKLLADGGAVGVFAGTLRHSGEIRANALVRDEGGNIVLKAANDIQIAAGSTTSASGKTGGNIMIESPSGHTRVAGLVTATGSEGKGGNISLLGNRVTATDGAVVDASGSARGGQILLGGDYQGANPAIRNSVNMFVGATATLRADATDNGDGGRIIVWSDDKAQFYGSLSAQGGPQGGNGGFAEVSGKNNLIFAGSVNLGSPKGSLGNLLLDPLDLFVFSGGGLIPSIIDEATDFPGNAATVSPATLAAITGNVNLFASRYMRISDPVTLTTPGQGLTAQVGTYTAPALPDPIALDTNTPNRLDIATNITTTGGAVALNAPSIQSVATSTIATGGGAISLNTSGAVQASLLSLNAGTGAVTATSGSILQLSAVTGGSFAATAPSSINIGGLITTGGGAVSLTSSGSSVTASNGATTGGGAVTIVSASQASNFGTISAGGGAVSMSGTGISGGTIDTTGAVTLSATAGSISSTVNNSSGVTAAAANSFNSTSININSTTALNASSVTATATNCFSTTSCPGANISLTATGDINVGTVAANAPATTFNASVFTNSISRAVSITSNGGSIRAASPASLVSATDVTLFTSLGSGGGIGLATVPLNVDVERQLSIRPNGDFNVVATGSGLTRLNAQLGVAATGQTYTGSLSRSSGGLTLNASATDTTVTVSNLAASGYAQRLYGQDPSITLRVPNGVLIANSITVPEGDTTPNSPPLTVPFYNTAQLPVSISSSGNLTVTSYLRQSTASSLAKSTSFSSDSGSVTLDTINASKDSVSVSASGFSGANIGISNLSTAGNVSVATSGGDITVGRIDTTSGTGVVSLSVPLATGAVKAQTDTNALEITSGSTISVSAKTIGTGGFANPLDIAGSTVTLSSTSATGGAIGFAGTPVVANTQNLIINATTLGSGTTTNGASFNVNTGAAALKNLTVSASAQAVGVAGPASVTTEGSAGVYAFTSDGTNFTFNPGTVPTANQFAGGVLNFTSNSGDIALGAANMGATGSLTVVARNGSITGGSALDGGGAITLTAGQVAGATPATITVGNVGAINRPGTIGITAGNNGFSTTRAGSVTTANIEGGAVTINSFNGNIALGNIGTTTRAGAVTLNANSLSGTSGTIQTGNATVASIGYLDLNNDITSGNIDATGGMNAASQGVFTTGTVNAASIALGTCFLCIRPQVSMGAVSGVQTVSIDSRTTTINGALNGDAAVADNISIFAASGPITLVGGTVNVGNGSTVSLTATDTIPFSFATINAGATGTVNLSSANGIQQTGGSGITAKTVSLDASGSTAPINQVGGDGRMDLNGTTALTINTGGAVAIDANGSTLSALTINKNQTPATAAFNLSSLGGGQSVSIASGTNPFELAVASPSSPLNFTLGYSAGNVTLVGGGISTSGGTVSLNSSGGGIDASTGGITTGGATGGGTVNLTAFGPITTGTINSTPTGTGTGGAITLGSTGITVSGDLRTGTGGGAISLGSSNAAITRTGGSQIVSDTGVTVTAINSDIGSIATPLLITSPDVTLNATGVSTSPSTGHAHATLTGTSSLNLTGENGFGVSSTTALNTLTAATRGTGVDTLALTAPGQTYSFARPAADVFGGAITNTFHVIAANGAATATFRALDGDLLIGGPGASLTSPTLTLLSSSTGDIKLQGTAANPLVLGNTVQNFGNFSSRDLLIRGNVTLTSATQNLSANRNITVQAEQGSIAINGGSQSLTSTGFSGGLISFKGGTAASETVMVSASGTQLISSPDSTSSAGIKLEGGDGAGSSATITYTGTGTQTIQAGSSITVKGGIGASSTALISTATGSQFVAAGTDIDVTGGSGPSASARIVNSGTGNQQVGESRAGISPFPYQTDNIRLQGGTATDAITEISAAGPQQVYVSGGLLQLKGGDGTNAFSRIESTSANEQRIGCATYLGGCANAIGTLDILGGVAGVGSYSRINAAGFQRVTSNTAINLTGTVADASASLLGAGQDIRFGNMALTAGAGNNANALVQSSSTQNIDPGNLTLLGGGGTGATATAQILATGNQTISFANTVALTGGAGVNSIARISTGGNQIINYGSLSITAGAADGSLAKIDATGTQSLSGGNLTLTAKGTEFAPIAGVSAIIEGQSQSINAGSIVINGGAGTAAGTTSDGWLRNVAGNQSVTASSITLNGGDQFTTTGILNQGAGTQQTITSFGSVRLNNPGGGMVGITSAGTQTVTAGAVEVLTNPTIAPVPGTSTISAAGNQWIRTINGSASGFGSMHVSAFGAGTASIVSGASQLIQLDYPDQMQTAANGNLVIGNATSAGNSLVQAVDQTVFARSIIVQGPSGASAVSKLSASNVQTITTLQGGIQVLGGSGTDSLATIDPVTQNILANGAIDVTGGPGPGTNADASIVSAGIQNILVSNGGITLTAGQSTNSDALITAGAPQTIGAAGTIALQGGLGPGTNADAIISNTALGAAGAQTVTSFNGNITLTGGTTADSQALISSFGFPQIVTAPNGSVIIVQGPAAGATAGLVSATAPPAATLIDPSSQVLSEQSTQTDVIGELVPSTGQEGESLIKAPICQ